MEQNEYKSDILYVDKISDLEEKLKYVRKLQRQAKDRLQDEWYYFFRGKELELLNDTPGAVEMYEWAFNISKNLEFTRALIQIYTKTNDDENKKQWKDKQRNLETFLKDRFNNENEELRKSNFEKLKTHTESGQTVAEIYIKNYIEKWRKGEDDYSSMLYILKEWSSSTPLIFQGLGQVTNVGGGIYIQWYGMGIVIDPGINFVQNLHSRKVSVLDIDVVIVTHNHIDHNSDLKEIEDIKYQCAGNILESSSLGLNSQEKEHIRRNIHYYLDPGTYSQFISEIDDENKNEYIHKFKTNIKGNKLELIKEITNIEIQYFKTIHSTESNSCHTYGIVLTLRGDIVSRTIGYTSDTKYFDELGTYFKNADIIIANISEITLDDLKKVEYKNNHLGYHGCFDLANHKDVYPELFILSEFWGGKGDIRSLVSEYLQYEIWRQKKDIFVIPGDLNLNVDLVKNKIRCTNCGCFFDRDEIQVVNEEGESNSLRYLCKTCYAGK